MATLQELKDEILKGRRFKRRGYAEWYYFDPLKHTHFTARGDGFFADDWELEELPKEKKKVKLYACIHKGDAQKNIWCSVMYRAEHLFVGTENIIRLPNLDQEIEVEE